MERKPNILEGQMMEIKIDYVHSFMNEASSLKFPNTESVRKQGKRKHPL